MRGDTPAFVAHAQQVSHAALLKQNLKNMHMHLNPHSAATPVLAAAAAALGNLGYHHDVNRCSIVNAGGATLLPVAVVVLHCAC